MQIPEVRTKQSSDLKQVESDLHAMSQSIDASLREKLVGRRLHKLMQPSTDGQSSPPQVGLSKASWAVGVAIYIVLYSVLHRIPLSGWLLLLPAGYSAWWFDSQILPKVFFKGYTFRLMRREGDSGEEEHPHAYTVAPVHGSQTGFGFENWKPVRGVEPGHLVVSIQDSEGRGMGVISLRTAGSLPVSSWARDYHQEDALPPMDDTVKALALRFDAECDRFLKFGQRIESSKALQSRRTQPLAVDVEEAWSRVCVSAALRTRLQLLAEHFASGSSAASRGLLLYGPPGTGKTLIAKALAESMGCRFFPLSLSDLKAGYIGQSGEKVAKVWADALEEERAVIFVDECEGVFGRRGSVSTDSFSAEIVQTFLSQWDGFSKQSTVWVIGATNRRDLIDPAILSRFGEEVEVPLPDPDQRLTILEAQLRGKGVTGALPANAKQATQGMSGRELDSLAGRLARELRGAPLSEAKLLELTRDFRAQGSSVTDAEASWESLVIPEATLKELKATTYLLRQAEAAMQRGLQVPRGVLLYGPPGTGKTQIARTLAQESSLTFIAATTADLKAGFVGQSGQKVKELFARARESSPCLLFLDEIDVVATTRGSDSQDFSQEIVGQLLQELDGAKLQAQHVFVIAATNLRDELDAAVLSRFPKQIEIGLPDETARARLLEILLRNKPLGFQLEQVVEELSARTQGFSGRDLRNWIERAEQRAVSRTLEAGDGIETTSLKLEDFAKLE